MKLHCIDQTYSTHVKVEEVFLENNIFKLTITI